MNAKQMRSVPDGQCGFCEMSMVFCDRIGNCMKSRVVEARRIAHTPAETRTIAIISKPYMLHLGPNDTVAVTYRKAAADPERGYDIGGSNRRNFITRVLHEIADALFVAVEEGGA
jgi:hypothetical protein